MNRSKNRERSIESAHHYNGHATFLAHHFETPRQQFDTGKLGMWLFLVSEVLFFSGLFCVYAVYRNSHREVFANASQNLDLALGTINTVILLFSSLTMAWAVRSAQLGDRKGLLWCLGLTLACASAFLGIKGIEYAHKIDEGLLWIGASGDEAVSSASTGQVTEATFFGVYFAMTGLHAVHIVGGMGAITWLFVRARRGDFGPSYYGPVDYVGLYWHLVDVIWIFLFPLLYIL